MAEHILFLREQPGAAALSQQAGTGEKRCPEEWLPQQERFPHGRCGEVPF